MDSEIRERSYGFEAVKTALRQTKHGKKRANQAGMFCRDHTFQKWLVDSDLSFAVDEESAIAAVREFCQIDSRSELKSNDQAQASWVALLAQFESRGE